MKEALFKDQKHLQNSFNKILIFDEPLPYFVLSEIDDEN